MSKLNSQRNDKKMEDTEHSLLIVPVAPNLASIALGRRGSFLNISESKPLPDLSKGFDIVVNLNGDLDNDWDDVEESLPKINSTTQSKRFSRISTSRQQTILPLLNRSKSIVKGPELSKKDKIVDTSNSLLSKSKTNLHHIKSSSINSIVGTPRKKEALAKIKKPDTVDQQQANNKIIKLGIQNLPKHKLIQSSVTLDIPKFNSCVVSGILDQLDGSLLRKTTRNSQLMKIIEKNEPEIVDSKKLNTEIKNSEIPIIEIIKIKEIDRDQTPSSNPRPNELPQIIIDNFDIYNDISLQGDNQPLHDSF